MKVVAVACGAVALAAAAATPAWTHGTRIVGTVVSVTADELEIAVLDERANKETIVSFELNQRTRVRRDGDSLHCIDGRLQPGERVAVTPSTAVDGLLATYVYVLKR